MMKNIYTTIFASLLLLLASCSESEQPIVGSGYLVLSGLELQATETEQVSTRTVDEDFTVVIYQEGETNTVAATITYAANNEQGSKVELTAGNYYLQAYNQAYADGNYTKPVYFYQSELFTIEEDWITYVEAKVPLINFGVRLVLPDNFDDFFTAASLSVTVGSVSQTVGNGETVYFPTPAEDGTTTFSYTFSATNNDGETNNSSSSYGNNSPEGSRVAPGTVYEVTYNYATYSTTVQD